MQPYSRRHCAEATGLANGRPEDGLRDAAIPAGSVAAPLGMDRHTARRGSR